MPSSLDAGLPAVGDSTARRRTSQALKNWSAARNGSIAGTPNTRRDPLGEQRAEQAAERAGAGNLAEALLRRARVEALAGDQPEARAEQRTGAGDVQVDDHRGDRRRRWTAAAIRPGTAPRWPRTRPAPGWPARSGGRPARSAATSRSEQTDVAISIAGSAVKSSEVRNSASRVALPPTNCAVTAAAQIIVVTMDRVMFPNATRRRKPRNRAWQIRTPEARSRQRRGAAKLEACDSLKSDSP